MKLSKVGRNNALKIKNMIKDDLNELTSIKKFYH